MSTQEVEPVPAPADLPKVVVPQPAAAARAAEPTLLQIVALVIWVTCLAVGVLGWWLSVPQAPTPPPAPPPLPPVQVELMDVRVAPQVTPLPPPSSQTPQPDSPDLPPVPAVALPSPSIAFAVPVEGPVRIVGTKSADFARPAPRVERLVFGQGSGKQPAPEYPPQAVADHEEGAVGVQFTAGRDGRVIEAHAAQPSRWPLLNQAAVDVVRTRWSDPSWAGRTYLVSIRFKLN